MLQRLWRHNTDPSPQLHACMPTRGCAQKARNSDARSGMRKKARSSDARSGMRKKARSSDARSGTRVTGDGALLRRRMRKPNKRTKIAV